MRALQCNCGVYYSSAHPDNLVDPYCKNCGAKVRLVEPELPEVDPREFMERWEKKDGQHRPEPV